jgi:hypothetical protein
MTIYLRRQRAPADFLRPKNYGMKDNVAVLKEKL